MSVDDINEDDDDGNLIVGLLMDAGDRDNSQP